MKHVLNSTVVLMFLLSATAQAGVSININPGGVYGQINLGNLPAPQLIYPQPVIITPPVGIAPAPVYLHVPPGHAKSWGKYCAKYQACNRPVYFVQEEWYNNNYGTPRQRNDSGDSGHERHRSHHGKKKGHD